MNLLQPQVNHAQTLLNSLFLNGIAFDSSETGTGKTYVAAWIAKNFNAPVTVICPKAVIKTWNDVLAKFGIKAHVVVNYEKLTRGNTKHYTYNQNYWKGNIKGKHWYTSTGIDVNLPSGGLVILDEVHRCKALNSLNGELLTAVKNAGHNMLVLSATAATNVTEMKSFGFVTKLHGGYDYRNFCYKNGVSYNRFGAMVWDNANSACQEGMRNIHNSLYNVMGVASRMTRKMFGNIFPDNRMFAEAFDLGTNTVKIQKVYEVMQSELAALDERAKNYREHHFAIIMKARRQTELLKVPAMVDWIEDTFAEGISPVVFINFQDTMQAIVNRLARNKKYDGLIARIEGGQTTKARDNDIESFQNDTKRIMLVNIQAGNAGISLHDLNGKYPRHSLINPSWSAINTLQALGRIHRAEAKTPCIQKFIFAAETIEERQRERVQIKLNNLDLLNDGDLVLDVDLYNTK